MASTAVPVQGATLKVDDTTPGTADVLVGNFRSFSIEPSEAPDIDRSDLSSVIRETFVGLAGAGTFSAEWFVLAADAGQVLIRAAQGDSANKKTFKIELPNGDPINFAGYVKSAYGSSGGVDGLHEGGFSVLIDGAITYV